MYLLLIVKFIKIVKAIKVSYSVTVKGNLTNIYKLKTLRQVRDRVFPYVCPPITAQLLEISKNVTRQSCHILYEERLALKMFQKNGQKTTKTAKNRFLL